MAFPARAGMNRQELVIEIVRNGVPRACGDEPEFYDECDRLGMRSPRMRG